MKTRRFAAIACRLAQLTLALFFLGACASPGLPPASPTLGDAITSTADVPVGQTAATDRAVTPPPAGPEGSGVDWSSAVQASTPTAVLIPPLIAPCTPAAVEPDSLLVHDLSVPDGTRLEPNTRFTKTWRLRNNGNCPWPHTVELVLVSGQPFDCPERIPVSQVAPGNEVDISLQMKAPARPGTYGGSWQLRTPDGRLFGAVVYTRIIVTEDTRPSPTATAPPTPTLRPSPEPSATPPPTPTLRPSPEPSATPPPTPSAAPSTPPKPTRTPTSAATALPSATAEAGMEGACATPDARFASIVNQAASIGMEVGCATGPVTEGPGQIQAYWQNVDHADPYARFRSFVIARMDNKRIYVLDSQDVNTYQAELAVYADTWSAAMPDRPPACAPLAPPQGYIIPIQGIGKVWCEQSLWNTIGWPKELATAATLAVQETASGFLMEVTILPPKIYLIAADIETRAVTIQQVP